MQDRKLCFDDILLVPKYSELDSRTIPDISTRIGSLELKIPIISSPMDSITGRYMLVVMDKLGGIGILSRHINMDDGEELLIQAEEIKWAIEQGAENVGCAIGLKSDIIHKSSKLIECGCKVICIDVAHGDHKKMYEAVKKLSYLKNTYEFTIMAGNVCTKDAAINLMLYGADVIKIGIGPGAACTTRIMTGFGYPQLSAIMEIKEQMITRSDICLHKSIIADGGLRTTGDMVKSLWAGANACMIGYMLAGTNATPRIGGKKIYRGMSSRAASGRSDIAPEGIEIEVGDNGETEVVINEYIKGIRSGLAMGGASNIEELRKVDYVIVSPLSMEETLPRSR